MSTTGPTGRDWVPRVASTVAILVGLANIVAALAPSWWARLDLAPLAGVIPGVLQHAGTVALVVSGLAFLVIAGALARRKHSAWLLAVALLVAGAVAHLVEGPNYVAATVSVAFLLFLLVFRREFIAAGDPYTRRRALVMLVVLFCASVLLGLAMAWSVDRLAVQVVGWPATLGYVVLGMVGITTPLTYGLDPDILYYGLFALGVLTFGTALFFWLSASPAPGRLTEEDEAALRELLHRWGDADSLGYFALRRDKSVVWSPTRKAAIPYRMTGGVMLASGDPLGDPEAWPGAVSVFMAEAKRHAWVPGVVACSETGARVWSREAGLQALEIGDEAIVRPEEFSLEGRPMRNVRQMVNRVARSGVGTRIRRQADIDAGELTRLRELVDSWRVGDAERGFSMALGRFGDPADPECVVVTAERDGAVVGLLVLVPWGRDGLSLDLMRRDPTADAGVNELMIADLLTGAETLGVTRVSLNFAVFRAALERGERIGAPPLARAWRGTLLFASRWAQIESLYRFNGKFLPDWYPRYVLYPDGRFLPRVTMAYLEAERFLRYPVPSTSPRVGAW